MWWVACGGGVSQTKGLLCSPNHWSSNTTSRLFQRQRSNERKSAFSVACCLMGCRASPNNSNDYISQPCGPKKQKQKQKQKKNSWNNLFLWRLEAARIYSEEVSVFLFVVLFVFFPGPDLGFGSTTQHFWLTGNSLTSFLGSVCLSTWSSSYFASKLQTFTNTPDIYLGKNNKSFYCFYRFEFSSWIFQLVARSTGWGIPSFCPLRSMIISPVRTLCYSKHNRNDK